MRTLIYARYSSQLQNPRSIEDQIAACRARAARESWTIVGEHHDQAISGAAGLGESQRPGLHALLARVEAGGIDQVLTESTDRIARHQGDAYAVRERLQFAGARLYTLMDGEVDDIAGTIKGLFDARMRKDLAARVQRGHRGNIKQGRAASGVAYGYRRVARFDEKGEAIRGLREVDPDTAPIVKRIYREYAAGQSARAIAARLNADGIPSPRGRAWGASALIGPRRDGFGILCNPIYIGELQYGRSKGVVDPRTRQRRSARGDGNIETGQAPHLRIIDDTLFRAVQEQIESRATQHPERQRRPKHILSGLGECGVCGGNWIIVRRAYWGCAKANLGACDNRRLISTKDYEHRVMAELKGQMLAPDVVAAYLREYHRDHARQTAELARDRSRLQRKIDEATRKVERLVAAIAAGGSEFTEIRELLAAARDDRDRAGRDLAGLEALPVIALHPGLAERYRQSIEEIDSALRDENARIEAVPRLRALIARIYTTPSSARTGVDLRVFRKIDVALDLALKTVASIRSIRK